MREGIIFPHLQGGGYLPGESADEHKLGIKILWSFICQALLLGCQEQAHLQRKILALAEEDRAVLREVAYNPREKLPTLSIQLLHRLLSIHGRAVYIAFEGVDTLDTETLTFIVPLLLFLTNVDDRALVKLIFSGKATAESAGALLAVPAIDKRTEYRGQCHKNPRV